MLKKSLPSSEVLRTQAINDLQVSIDKEISRATHLASQCSLWELRYLIYILRLNRIGMLASKSEVVQPSELALHLNDDALKYAIELAAKYGCWHDIATINDGLKGYDDTRVLALMESTRRINGLFDHAMLLNISELDNENSTYGNKVWKTANSQNYPLRKLEFDYGLRIEHFAMHGKKQTLQIQELICKLILKFAKISEIFEVGSHISLVDYCTGLAMLNSTLTNRLKSLDESLKNKSEVYDPLSYLAFCATTRSLIYTDSELEQSFDDEFISYLRNNSFDATQLSDRELRYHYISRKPFLRGNGFMIFSPELVFDSILDNCHYTLLEDEVSKNAYQAHYGRQFVDKVAKSAESAGYIEKGRDIYLAEGRNTIGDIDLVLQNPQTGHTLFIECKNHKLPLNVQFRATGKVLKHIESTIKWETKVQKRIQHLKGQNPDYVAEGKWNYIIVTFMPQPLSHQSPLLIMTVEEFEQWLSKTPRASCFSELFEQVYINSSMRFTESEIESFRDANFAFIKHAH